MKFDQTMVNYHLLITTVSTIWHVVAQRHTFEVQPFSKQLSATLLLTSINIYLGSGILSTTCDMVYMIETKISNREMSVQIALTVK